MNKFRKYCPNVWVAECEEEYEKGDVIELETKYGKTVECEVYNLVAKSGEKYFYSIVRLEEKTYAQRKAEKYNNSAENHIAKSNQYLEASNEGREFLSLGEPIKIGHHSEKRHRALIERNWNRMGKSVESAEKAKEAEQKAKYWEHKKEYLRGYERAVRQMERSELRIREIRLNKLCPSVIIDDMPHGSEKNDLSNYAAALDEAKEEYTQARYLRIKRYNDISDKIECLKNEDEKDVLLYKYLRLLNFSQVSDRIEKSYRQTLRIHGKALNNLKI